MKRFLWLMAGLALASCLGETQAQVIFVPAYPPDYAVGYGFEFRSKGFKAAGFLYKIYPPGYFPGPYGYPGVVVQKNVTINVYGSPNVNVAPAKDYDLSGVDLDVVKPKAYPSLTKVNSEVGPEPGPMPNLPIPPLPGKNVSIPKKVIRPEDEIEPVKPKVGAEPGKAPDFPKPAPPLEIPREESDRLIALGLEEFKERNFGLAGQHFKKAAQVDPSNFLAHLLLAQADFAFARFGQALLSVRASMKLNKDYPNLKFQPRFSLYKGMEGEFEDQLALLREAVKQQPKSPELLFLLAHQLWFDEQRDAALELLQKARPLAADPTFIDVFLNAGKPKVVAAK